MIGEILGLPVARFFFVGGALYGLGLALLALLIEWGRMTKGRANLVVLVLTLQLSFLLNNFWSFESQIVFSSTELVWRWVQYHLVRAIPIFLEQATFVYLTGRRKWHYAPASAFVVVAGFLFVYAASASFIFVPK